MRDMATALYDMAADMDFADYDDTKEETINDLEYVLFYLKCAADNPLNHDGFRAILKALETITNIDC